eukprot:1105330-Pleurochrysis_carterae.AAC.1
MQRAPPSPPPHSTAQSPYTHDRASARASIRQHARTPAVPSPPAAASADDDDDDDDADDDDDGGDDDDDGDDDENDDVDDGDDDENDDVDDDPVGARPKPEVASGSAASDLSSAIAVASSPQCSCAIAAAQRTRASKITPDNAAASITPSPCAQSPAAVLASTVAASI